MYRIKVVSTRNLIFLVQVSAEHSHRSLLSTSAILRLLFFVPINSLNSFIAWDSSSRHPLLTKYFSWLVAWSCCLDMHCPFCCCCRFPFSIVLSRRDCNIVSYFVGDSRSSGNVLFFVSLEISWYAMLHSLSLGTLSLPFSMKSPSHWFSHIFVIEKHSLLCIYVCLRWSWLLPCMVLLLSCVVFGRLKRRMRSARIIYSGWSLSVPIMLSH